MMRYYKMERKSSAGSGNPCSNMIGIRIPPHGNVNLCRNSSSLWPDSELFTTPWELMV